jgi:tRNA isopentenyl-2-thiomethyl-A-37 hydroxylase MiaE
MKAVSNSKTWGDYGWLYRMRRYIDGQVYGNNLLISKYEMHHRNLVAKMVRKSREDLRRFIQKDQASLDNT